MSTTPGAGQGDGVVAGELVTVDDLPEVIHEGLSARPLSMQEVFSRRGWQSKGADGTRTRAVGPGLRDHPG